MNMFLTVGTSNISENLFLPIQDSMKELQIKPFGGLWLTSYDPKYPNYNEWIEFLINNPHLLYFKNGFENTFEKEGAIVVLKDNAKIFQLNTLKDLETLQYLFPHPYSIFSYEALSCLYDGIYINTYSLNYELIKNGIYDFSFDTFGVRTLLLFNLDAIDYYLEAKISIDPDFEYNHDYTTTINLEEKTIKKEESYPRELLRQLRDYLGKNNIDWTTTSYWDLNQIICKFLEESNNLQSDINERNLCRILVNKLHTELP